MGSQTNERGRNNKCKRSIDNIISGLARQLQCPKSISQGAKAYKEEEAGDDNNEEELSIFFVIVKIDLEGRYQARTRKWLHLSVEGNVRRDVQCSINDEFSSTVYVKQRQEEQ